MCNRLLVMGNYWGGLHAQMTPAVRENGTFLGTGTGTAAEVNGGSIGQAGRRRRKPSMDIICSAVKMANGGQPGLWTYDLHQYFDYNSTGNWDCDYGWDSISGGGGGDQPSTPGAYGTLGAIVEFTNFTTEYARHNEVSLAVTEFRPRSTRCFRWMGGFLNMLSMAGPMIKQTSAGRDEVGGVIAWTVARLSAYVVVWGQ